MCVLYVGVSVCTAQCQRDTTFNCPVLVCDSQRVSDADRASMTSRSEFEGSVEGAWRQIGGSRLVVFRVGQNRIHTSVHDCIFSDL